MGLDLYLQRNISQKALINSQDKLFKISVETDPNINSATNPELTTTLDKALTSYIEEYSPEVSILAGYWSNTFALNQWFTNKLENADSVNNAEITIETLQELKTIIDKILEVRRNKSLKDADDFAQDYFYRDMRFLEPETGHFDNDDEFYTTLEQTKEILKTEINIYNVLKANDFEYAITWTYSASW